MSTWRALATGWERGRDLHWRATQSVSEWLVSRLDPRPGDTVLELAAGTGETGFLVSGLLGPAGRLISSDAEPGMVEATRRAAAERGIENAEFRVLDTNAIALPDASVDGVLSRYGYVLRGDPPAALREVRRVLRPGGRFAFAVWAGRSQNPWMTVPADLMVERGHLAPPSSDARRLSERRNPAAIAVLVANAGFEVLELEEMPVSYVFADGDELWRFATELRGPVSLALAQLGPAERDEIRGALEARVPRAADGYELGGVSLNVVAS